MSQDGQKNGEEARIAAMLKLVNEAERKGVALELVVLKDFLNSDSAGTDQALKEEILGLISPILSPAPEADVLDGLKAIVRRVNSLGISAEWTAEAEAPKGKVGEFPSGLLHELWLRGLGPGKGILNLAGKKYRVRQDWREETGTQRHYLAVIDALEDGTFTKLRRCKKCSRFFIADRRSDRFCSAKCSKATFSGDAAKDRVYAIRRGQKNLVRLLDATAGEKLPAELKQILRRFSTQAVNDLRKKRKRRVPIAKLWKRVPKEVKKLLQQGRLEDERGEILH
jgi:hypothetical protein